MEAFFQTLGDNILDQWKRTNFSLEKFPALATSALQKARPSANLDLDEFLRAFLLDDRQAFQTESGFGEPEIVVYDHARFYIQMLFWLNGTTAIHQHEFSGAFHVLCGSSIHARFDFLKSRPVTPYMRVGDLQMRRIELLEVGATVPIHSGPQCIHSLFHLDSPSITLVVRTQNDPGSAPQFNYHPPHLALDPLLGDTLTMRRRQVLGVLEQTAHPDYVKLVREMIRELDFERGFYILQAAMPYLQDLGEWANTLQAYEEKHGSLAAGIGATLEESMRREAIRALRANHLEPEHRFFLALLMNVTHPADLLALVAQRFPKHPPATTVLRWLEELMEFSADSIVILDAVFAHHDPQPILAVLEELLTPRGRKKSKVSKMQREDILAAIRASSLGVLAA
jgi:hypothetical protein